MNMMHVISIPYALMKVNPLSWIQKVCQYKGNEINLKKSANSKDFCFVLKWEMY